MNLTLILEQIPTHKSEIKRHCLFLFMFFINNIQNFPIHFYKLQNVMKFLDKLVCT